MLGLSRGKDGLPPTATTPPVFRPLFPLENAPVYKELECSIWSAFGNNGFTLVGLLFPVFEQWDVFIEQHQL